MVERRSVTSGREAAPFSGKGLHGRVLDALGVRIVSGEFAPGDAIDLDGVASKHSASHTVVRETIKVFVGKGLVDALPGCGTFAREREAREYFGTVLARRPVATAGGGR